MNKLLTVWGEALDRDHPLPEYPRPQLVRSSYVNLDGVWRYAIAKGAERCAAYPDRPTRWDGKIVVPFAPESILSGAERRQRPNEALWYERPVTLPEGFVKDRVLLRFGVVDQIAGVYWNGAHAARHEGSYLPFSADITQYLRAGENTLTVRVTDSLIDTPNAYGKQRYKHGRRVCKADEAAMRELNGRLKFM